MHRLFPLAILGISVSASLTAATPAGVEKIITSLENVDCYSSRADFSVTMPQLNDDVVYSLRITQQAAKADTLLPCAYLIDWTMTSREEPVGGFSAYFSGNHYRYAGERLQEYHTKWDPIPFSPLLPGQNSSGGVQRTAQFANLLPATIAEQLRSMTTDPRYTIAFHPDTIVNNEKVAVIEAVMDINGTRAMEATFVFDPRNNMPRAINFENNPGAVSEQTVNVKFDNTELSSSCPPITEESLMATYREVFENFRESNFRIENLPGTKLPGFALPTTSGERYMRRTGDVFATPTIVALLDASHSFTPEMIAALRSATDALPYNADLIMAFIDRHVDQIEEIVPSLRPGEHLLMGAKPLVRDCGAASLPAVILCNTQGIVENVILGFNNDLTSDVIQKMALISPSAGSEKAVDSQTNNPETNYSNSMETVHFQGQPCHTYGFLPSVGSQAPEFNLTGADLSAIKNSDFKGNTIVLNIFPSLDTEVCARSVRQFNEEAGKLENTKVVCVSVDLPFAMSRFCTLEGLKNVIPASAFRSPQFGEKYGVMLVDGPLAGLLTRAVIVINPEGTVVYRDLVDEITHEPDYEGALRVIKGE